MVSETGRELTQCRKQKFDGLLVAGEREKE